MHFAALHSFEVVRAHGIEATLCSMANPKLPIELDHTARSHVNADSDPRSMFDPRAPRGERGSTW